MADQCKIQAQNTVQRQRNFYVFKQDLKRVCPSELDKKAAALSQQQQKALTDGISGNAPKV